MLRTLVKGDTHTNIHRILTEDELHSLFLD